MHDQASFRLKQILAFAAVYIVWGSTYLAIRYAIETLPGFGMAGVRFLIAGMLLYGWALLRGAGRPEWRHWRDAIILGGLLFLGGNGLVVWAEHRTPSGLAALLVGTEPLWVALLLWIGGRRPTLRIAGGLFLGFCGAALLAIPTNLLASEPIHVPSALALTFASFSWALGSLYGARRAEMPASPAQATAMQLLSGGVWLLLTSALLGEWRGFEIAAVSTKSVLALGYLIVFGALVAFSAYSWLVRTTEPTLVATYAYVNPAVAVVLGWQLANEPFGLRTVIAMVLIVGSVVLVSLDSRHKEPAPVAEAEGDTLPLATNDIDAPAPLEKCA